MELNSKYWGNDKCTFIRNHNYWHLALLYLENNNLNLVFKTLDNHIWGMNKVTFDKAFENKNKNTHKKKGKQYKA